jgi:hypothetical protein
MSRPSRKELDGKIRAAKEAASRGRISIINPLNLAADALELGFSVKDLSCVLLDLLAEVTSKAYAGQAPPKRSYENEILDRELFAFRWVSKRLGCAIYLKFALKGNELWVVSLHQDRQREKEEIR